MTTKIFNLTRPIFRGMGHSSALRWSKSIKTKAVIYVCFYFLDLVNYFLLIQMPSKEISTVQIVAADELEKPESDPTLAEFITSKLNDGSQNVEETKRFINYFMHVQNDGSIGNTRREPARLKPLIQPRQIHEELDDHPNESVVQNGFRSNRLGLNLTPSSTLTSEKSCCDFSTKGGLNLPVCRYHQHAVQHLDKSNNSSRQASVNKDLNYQPARSDSEEFQEAQQGYNSDNNASDVEEWLLLPSSSNQSSSTNRRIESEDLPSSKRSSFTRDQSHPTSHRIESEEFSVTNPPSPTTRDQSHPTSRRTESEEFSVTNPHSPTKGDQSHPTSRRAEPEEFSVTNPPSPTTRDQSHPASRRAEPEEFSVTNPPSPTTRDQSHSASRRAESDELSATSKYSSRQFPLNRTNTSDNWDPPVQNFHDFQHSSIDSFGIRVYSTDRVAKSPSLSHKASKSPSTNRRIESEDLPLSKRSSFTRDQSHPTSRRAESEEFSVTNPPSPTTRDQFHPASRRADSDELSVTSKSSSRQFPLNRTNTSANWDPPVQNFHDFQHSSIDSFGRRVYSTDRVAKSPSLSQKASKSSVSRKVSPPSSDVVKTKKVRLKLSEDQLDSRTDTRPPHYNLQLETLTSSPSARFIHSQPGSPLSHYDFQNLLTQPSSPDLDHYYYYYGQYDEYEHATPSPSMMQFYRQNSQTQQSNLSPGYTGQELVSQPQSSSRQYHNQQSLQTQTSIPSQNYQRQHPQSQAQTSQMQFYNKQNLQTQTSSSSLNLYKPNTKTPTPGPTRETLYHSTDHDHAYNENVATPSQPARTAGPKPNRRGYVEVNDKAETSTRRIVSPQAIVEEEHEYTPSTSLTHASLHNKPPHGRNGSSQPPPWRRLYIEDWRGCGGCDHPSKTCLICPTSPPPSRRERPLKARVTISGTDEASSHDLSTSLWYWLLAALGLSRQYTIPEMFRFLLMKMITVWFVSTFLRCLREQALERIVQYRFLNSSPSVHLLDFEELPEEKN